jgi:site-specific DNA-methyltransferase (adenine-specific)
MGQENISLGKMTNLRPFFSTNLGLLYNTDCFNLFASLKDETLDCIFADPPFNLGKNYGNGFVTDDLDRNDYLEWCFSWIDEFVRLIKPGGTIFIYTLPRWGYHLSLHLEKSGMTFRHWIALSMKGTFPRGKKLYPAHYALLYFTKGVPKTFNRVRLPIPKCRHCGRDIKDYGGHRKYLNPLGINLTDFWDDTSPARHQKFKSRWHINELKPMISSRCIEISTVPGEIVMDSFGGGGSTYEAAQQLDRYWIGVEIGDCSIIKERFERDFTNLQKGLPEKLTDIFKNGNPKFSITLSKCQKSLKNSRTMGPNRESKGLVSVRS